MVINMQALISTIEPREDGYRVAEVVQDGNTFPVADVFFWHTCPDYVVADQYWYDPRDEQFYTFPPPPAPTAAGDQANVSGAQTL